MNTQGQLRPRLLAVTGAGVAALAIYSLVSPTAGHRELAAHRFPESVPLPGWELIGGDPLHEQRKNTSHCPDVVQSGQRYRYRREGISLDAEIRYMAGTLGDITVMLRDQAGIPREVFRQRELRHDAAIGWHSLFAHEHRAYLSACINRRGSCTVTDAQFRANHREHDFRLDRVWPCLIGRESLRDYRCLWVNLSTPAEQAELSAAYAQLETAWADWHRPWQSRFPGY